MNKNFNKRCYQKLTLIPKGMISTYFELAKSLDSNAYRAVGNAMENNPNPISVPCHRIIRNNGTLGGYTLGIKKKFELLNKEGIKIKNNKIVDFEKKLFQFK